MDQLIEQVDFRVSSQLTLRSHCLTIGCSGQPKVPGAELRISAAAVPTCYAAPTQGALNGFWILNPSILEYPKSSV